MRIYFRVVNENRCNFSASITVACNNTHESYTWMYVLYYSMRLQLWHHSRAAALCRAAQQRQPLFTRYMHVYWFILTFMGGWLFLEKDTVLDINESAGLAFHCGQGKQLFHISDILKRHAYTLLQQQRWETHTEPCSVWLQWQMWGGYCQCKKKTVTHTYTGPWQRLLRSSQHIV